MVTKTKHFGLLLTTALTAFWAAQASANISTTTSDELYSESIYIQKSAAEVPGALESNARVTSEADLSIATDKAIESIEDLDAGAGTKKISKRSNPKKVTND